MYKTLPSSIPKRYYYSAFRRSCADAFRRYNSKTWPDLKVFCEACCDGKVYFYKQGEMPLAYRNVRMPNGIGKISGVEEKIWNQRLWLSRGRR